VDLFVEAPHLLSGVLLLLVGLLRLIALLRRAVGNAQAEKEDKDESGYVRDPVELGHGGPRFNCDRAGKPRPPLPTGLSTRCDVPRACNRNATTRGRRKATYRVKTG
jgi:hypothetical protein